MKLSFEDVLVGGYKICLMIFTLWLGWVIFDEVKMQRDAVTTLAQVAKASSASAYESALEGECYLHGRSANCGIEILWSLTTRQAVTITRQN